MENQKKPPSAGPRWIVLEFKNGGAESRLNTADREAAREAYDAIPLHGQLTEVRGRDDKGQPIPGVMMHNLVLARKLNGTETIKETA